MPALADHQSSKFTKILYIGDSSSGKTGSLVSLVKDGYKLRILDMDNGLDILRQYVKKECPELIGNVDYETRRDEYKASPAGPVIRGTPKAFVQALELMTKWSDGSDPSEWGPDSVFVLDTLTSLGAAALSWSTALNSGKNPDTRNLYFQAQEACEKVVALLTDEAFHANVIVISHVNYREFENAPPKGYPSAIGSAIGPKLPKYFNTLVLAESIGSGKNVKRRIKVNPTGLVDLKTPAPFKLTEDLPLETGLSTIFKTLKD